MAELILADMVFRLVIAAILGGIIGLERELHSISAGFRTLTLVCIGAALFTLSSVQFSALSSSVDVTRIAAGIVTGVGFLGAGVIFSDKKGLHGLTTAADVWTVAAIGLLVGMGQFELAATATLLIVIVLTIGKNLEKKLLHRKRF